MAFALCATQSGAQSVPAAAPPDTSPMPARVGSASDIDVEGEAKVRVKAITISGNQALPASELQQLVAGMVGTERSLGQLNATARRITAYYRERGYTAARAHLAQQDIRDGVIGIVVMEGRAASPAPPAAEPRPGDRGLFLLHILRSQR
jgi:hemolysin activation/secretion protein